MRAVLLPVKSFGQAKNRLKSVLSESGRKALAQELAATVIAASGELVYVVCDDGGVADFAVRHGAIVLWAPGFGLSGAVGAAVEHLRSDGIDQVVVAHADLPLAAELEKFGDDGVITLAPDRHLDGTNVIALPTGSGFHFSYGPGSFSRHRSEAIRVGLAHRIHYEWRLAADIDTPDDLEVVSKSVLNNADDERHEPRWLSLVVAERNSAATGANPQQ